MERSIILNAEDARKILAGQKAFIRRAIKPQPKMCLAYISGGDGMGKWAYPPPKAYEVSGWDKQYKLIDGLTGDDIRNLWTPPCHGDDILRVREPWNWGIVSASDPEGIGYELRFEEALPGRKFLDGSGEYLYRADDPEPDWRDIQDMKWKSAATMPRDAARIFLRVNGVSVARLQDIDEDGAKADGANCINGHNVGVEEKMRRSAVDRFAEQWDNSLKPKDRALYGWNANPFVWVISFERVKK